MYQPDEWVEGQGRDVAAAWRGDGMLTSLIAAFVVGAVVGSFLNVCIWRVPAGESVVYPPSHCPGCGTRIRSADNIPLLSYLLLRGRCRTCGVRISPRYPAVEALTGVMFAVLLWEFGPSAVLGVYAGFVAALIVITFIDLDHQIIPDAISLPGIAVGLACAALGYGPPLLDSAIGVGLGGGSLYAIAVGYHALTGREGMGGGDIKLLAMIGAFLGWRGVLVTLVLGSFTGAVVGVTLILARGADARLPIPFGPFLALGAVCALLFGDPLIHWYLHFALPA
jgi:leader peptidase (prepilin peptidase)/N-methyltransferase